MKVLKLWYHFKATVKKVVYKVVFGKKLSIGRGTTWRHDFHVAIESNGKIDIGSNCFFNNNCSVNALEHVSIGDGTIFGADCHVYDHNHRFRSSDKSIKSQGYSVAPVHIGKHVWIGAGVIILKGITIGDNAVIGAGVVVDENVPSGCIVKNVGISGSIKECQN